MRSNFPDGQILLLPLLGEGQLATVLQLPLSLTRPPSYVSWCLRARLARSASS